MGSGMSCAARCSDALQDYPAHSHATAPALISQASLASSMEQHAASPSHPSWASRQTLTRQAGDAVGRRGSLAARLALPQGSELRQYVELLEADKAPQRSSAPAWQCGVSLE